MQPPEVTIITEQPAISAESLMQTSITTSLASVIATALSNGEMVHIEFTPTADGGISATIDGGTTPLVLPDEPTINPTQGVDNEPDRLRDAACSVLCCVCSSQQRGFQALADMDTTSYPDKQALEVGVGSPGFHTQ